MKLLSKIIFSSFLLIISVDSFAQYITLEGKQFKDASGNNFYPVVMNYGVDLTYDNSSVYKIAPHHAYGGNTDYECGTPINCTDWIENDLNEIADMGFNTIRLFGIAPSKARHLITGITCPTDDNNHSYFRLIAEHYPNVDVCQYSYFDILQPYDYSTNANLAFLFDQIETILDKADAAGLKVILVCGGGKYILNNNFSPTPGYPSEASIEDEQAADYQAYLSALAAHFETHPALMAYDLMNEPAWTDGDYHHKKAKICEWVGEWYDALKANDDNHLVTIGLSNLHDVLEWDPAVLKLDFNSEHFYPTFRKYEWIDPPPLAIINDRYHNELVWMQRNYSMPWIIGETGFVANDVDVPAIYQQLAWVWGSESDQSDFTEFSLNESRDAGASGYAWWQFQDVHWFGPLPNPTDYNQNWFGLLRYADPDASGVYDPLDRKDAVTKVQAFDPYTLGTFAGPTSTYTNNLNHPVPANPNNIITGHVQDQDGNPIADAVVFGWTNLKATINPPPAYDFHYVFTDVNGDFEIRPYDYEGSIDQELIEAFRISAPGAEVYYANWGVSGATINLTYIPDDPTDDVYTNLTYELKREQFKYDTDINNITVGLSDTRKFKGWNTLNTTDVIIEGTGTTGGIADFKARKEVHINTEFHAQHGSEVHIFNEETFPECPDLSSYNRVASSTEAPSSPNNGEKKSIVLHFKPHGKTAQMDVFPNPGNGIFHVEITSSVSNSFEYQLTDAMGGKILTGNSNQPVFELNLSFLSKGIYLFKINTGNEILIQKIIIN